MWPRASTFLVLLTFRDLSGVLCSELQRDLGDAHRLLVERQVVVTETATDDTAVTTIETTVGETVIRTEPPITATSTSTMVAPTPTPIVPPSIVITPSPTTNSAGSPLPTCPVGHFECAAEFQGGCCPTGYGCAIYSCIPPATVTNTRACMPSSTTCPVSVGGGCCPDGYSCGVTICSPLATAPAVVITEANTITTKPALTATQIVMKGTDVPIGIKVPPSTPTPVPGVASRPRHFTLPKLTLAGLVVGSVVGTLLLVGVVWFTCRRVRGRGNTDVFHSGPGQGEVVAAPTGRFYDPNHASPRRLHRTVPRPWGLGMPSPPLHKPPMQLPYGYGHNGEHNQTAEMEATPPYNIHQPPQQTDGVQYAPPPPVDSPPPPEFKDVHDARVELGDTSQPNQQMFHEVEGDQPGVGTRSSYGNRRWSTGLERLRLRGSSSTNGGGSGHF